MEKIPVFSPALGIDTIKHLADALHVGWLGMGAITKEFEDLISEYLGLNRRHVIATNTATSALHLALRIAKIGKGDEVITPSFNCVADQQSILNAGAEVVMCDIKEDNLGIDCEKVESLITKKTKAIVPLHYAGIPCDQKKVYAIAKKYNLRVIEDACHAFGTTINGRKIGSYGDMAFFSFDAVKTITCIDGGCLVLNNPDEFERGQHMRLLGMNKDTIERYKNKRSWDYDVITEGYRYHLNNIMASVGISQIKKIEEIVKSRQKVCQHYNSAFKNIEGVKTPQSDFKNISPFIYVLRVLDGKRKALIEHLKTKSIETGIHWTPVHKFSFFANSRCGDLTITNKISNEILTLPLHSNMKEEYVNRVIEGVQSFFKK